MAVVKEDIIQGNNGNLTIRGWEFDRIFIVSELTSFGAAKGVEAVDATGIPFGDPHPAVALAFAIQFTPESIPSSDAMRVTIKYKEYSQDYLTELGVRKLNRPTTDYFYIGGSAETTEMILGYTYPDDYELDTKIIGKTGFQSPSVEVQEYYPTIVITRTEFFSISADVLSGHPLGTRLTGEMLTDRGLQYNGRLNQEGWNLRPTDPADSWRCEITAVSAEDGLAYRVRYAFSYDPELWLYSATYKDPNSGEPVADVDNAVARVPVPRPVDWPASDLVTKRDFAMFQDQNFSLLELPV